ncbi:site-specific recombinase [Flavobacterium selenitireducens]|uniref:site-specific recombinase n=1 Tax=Flavobacterium selenitireducens TaxID=2722704 RepID=UPI00168BD294|nr:recombinase [Flavobacterium selenitireducens]MBD3582101.1 site-specific recombinase [Flavobacterium selenitireducens]
MKFGNRKKKITPKEFIAQQCKSGLPWQQTPDDLDVLVRLIQLIRPKHPKKVAMVDLSEFIAFLDANPLCREKLGNYVRSLLWHKKFNRFLSDAGILSDADFFYEIKRRIVAKFLPRQPQQNQLEYILIQVFYLSSDRIWIEKIPIEQLEQLFDLLGFKPIYNDVEPDSPLSEVLLAMHLIAQRISGRAMESDVIKMVPEFDDLESPFIAFEKELLQIDDRIRKTDIHYIRTQDLTYRQLRVLHQQCVEFVDRAFANSSKYGISIKVNQNLLKIRQQLERLKVMMPLLAVDDQRNRKQNSIALGLQLIRYNGFKNNVRKFVSESTQLISYEITQHTAKTGEHYITETSGGYFKMLRSALGGGLIVGFLCVSKVLLSKVETSTFGHAFLYSMNYAFGFILIYLTGATLATKQPAMTASALARALEEGRGKGKRSDRYAAFASLFARVFRSQFIAFVGNVAMAFPVSLLLIWLIDYSFDYNIAQFKYPTLLHDISPVHSPAIFHAAIAGVFLFLSGIISGTVANRDKHNHIYYRIQHHPVLKDVLGRERTHNLAKWYEKRWAGIVSNFWFGVFMGSTAPIGFFLGLDLDVRHITFVSGNLALGLFGSGFDIRSSLLTWCLIGIVVIGLVNFLVSFTLSVTLALRSRNISFFELRFVATAVFRHFLKKPLSFFFPTEKRIDDTQAVSH